MNGLYIRGLSVGDFIERTKPFLKAAGIELSDEMFTAIAPHVQERVKVLTEVPAMVDFLMDRPLVRQMDAMFQKGVDSAKAVEVLSRSGAILEQLPDFSVSAIDQALRGVATDLGLKPGPAFVVLRIAVTGKTVTPPLFESFAVLGRNRVLSRIDETLKLLA
jgi:glutamyl-tRNA synthetase